MWMFNELLKNTCLGDAEYAFQCWSPSKLLIQFNDKNMSFGVRLDQGTVCINM